MTQPDASTMSTMAQYARHRAVLWQVMGTVIGPVTDELVARAVDGRLARDVENATHFVGETNPFDGEIPSRREVFEHGRKADGDAERAALRADLEHAYDDSLTPVFEAAGRACADEAAAWEADDAEAAKAARLTQFTTLRDQLDHLTDWCVALYRNASTEQGRMIARLVAAHLALESGANVKAEVKH